MAMGAIGMLAGRQAEVGGGRADGGDEAHAGGGGGWRMFAAGRLRR